jgi:hypothetical protein
MCCATPPRCDYAMQYVPNKNRARCRCYTSRGTQPTRLTGQRVGQPARPHRQVSSNSRPFLRTPQSRQGPPLRAAPRTDPSVRVNALGSCRTERVTHRSAVHLVAAGELPDAAPFNPAISADTFIKLHLRLLLHAPSGRETLVGSRTVRPQGLLEGGATSSRHNGPYRGQIRLSFPLPVYPGAPPLASKAPRCPSCGGRLAPWRGGGHVNERRAGRVEETGSRRRRSRTWLLEQQSCAPSRSPPIAET